MEPYTKENGDFSNTLSSTLKNYSGIVGYAVLFCIIYLIFIVLTSGVLESLFPTTHDYKNEVLDIVKGFGNGKKFDMDALNDLQAEIDEAKTGSVALVEMLIQSVTHAIVAPLIVGLLYLVHKFQNQKVLDFGDLFIGYRQNTKNILLYGFLSTLAIEIGLKLWYIPGLYLSVVLFLGLPIVFFEDTTAIDALKKSFKIAHNNFFQIFMVWLLSALLGFSGVIFCGIGLVVTLPIFFSARYFAYANLIGKPREI